MHRLRYSQLLPLDIDTAFAFFADAGNLERLTPPWLHFRILSQLPLEMRRGALIDYELRLRGMPIRWRTEITTWEPPFRFVDKQVRGPYQLWEHTHTFEAVGDATLVTDEVIYVVPGARAGDFVNTLMVRPDLERIFSYRRDQMQAWALDMLRDPAKTPAAASS